MRAVYFDTSALIKLLVAEEGRVEALALWAGCDLTVTSLLTYPEVCAALAAIRRNRRLTNRSYTAAADTWEETWAALRPIRLTEVIGLLAGTLARQRVLHGADAVHLATALAIPTEHVVLATWDHRLRDAALAEGLAVAPAPPRH